MKRFQKLPYSLYPHSLASIAVVLGMALMGLAYADTFKADQYCIEKFGNNYKHYLQEAPRVNFLAGIIRFLRRRRKGLR